MATMRKTTWTWASRSAWRRACHVLAAVAALALSPTSAFAALEDGWNASTCIGCHGPSGPVYSTNANASYNNILLHLSETFSTSWCSPGHAGNGTTMCTSFGSYFTSPGTTDLAAVYNLVVGARDTVVSSSAGADAVSAFSAIVGFTQSRTVTITNYRDENLDFRPSVTSSNFAVSNSTCTSVTASPLTLRVGAATSSGSPNFNLVPTSCSITVTFQPSASTPVSASDTLNISFTAYSTTAPRTRNISLNGTPIPRIEIAPSGTVTFTTAAPHVPFVITDRVGSSTQLCVHSPTDSVPPGSFDGKSNFSLDGYTLTNGCVTVPGASPRTINLGVTFSPNGVTTPLDADLDLVGGGTDQLTVHLHGNPGPVLSVDALTLFNTTSIEADGTASADLPLTIANKGTTALSFAATPFAIADSTLNGDVCGSVPGATNSGEYTIVGNTCGAGLAPAASCSLTLRFDPSGVGRRCGALSINTTNAGPGVVVLAGVGIHGPRLVVNEGPATLSSGALLDFTSQRPGLAYPARTLTLTNGSTAGQVGLSIVLPASTSVPGFTLTPSSGCAQPLQAAGATSCTIAIAFAPTLVQPYSGSFAIQSRRADAAPGDPYSSFTVSLTGKGTNTAPVLSWRDGTNALVAALDFGTTSAGTPIDRHVFLSNAGPGGAHVSVVNAVGVDSFYFQVLSSTCVSDQFLAETATCDVTVRFNPGGAGARSATLQLIGDGNGPGTLTLQGTGMGPATPGVLTVSSVAPFDTVRVGAQSTPLEVTLGNAGNFPLTVQNVSVVGPFKVQSLSCASMPFVLAPGGSCRMVVTFEPTSSGAAQGMLVVATDASATSTQVALAGEGQDAANVSSGGCSSVDGASPADPMLWVLVIVAVGILWNRSRSGPKS